MTLEASSGPGTQRAPTHEPLVSVLYTSAPTVLDDFRRVMELANFRQHLPQTSETLLKVNISWQHYYPGCSTSPWQLDGVTQTLKNAGYDRITPVQNGTVVVDSHDGERGNKHDKVFE
ncbi:MAG: hypothetical protein ABIQ47_08870, partial [Tepidiformaceae bacterium]